MSGAMASNSATYKFISKERPPCSLCGRPLLLTRAEPAEAGFELRIYFCANCAGHETVIAPA
jgi:hypothetical protein